MVKIPKDPPAMRALIEARRLSLRGLAALTSQVVPTSHTTIRRLLAGQATTPERARRIAVVLRVPLDELFVDVGRSASEQSSQCERVA